MNRVIAFLSLIGFGAVLRYIFDPRWGRVRRAQMGQSARQFSRMLQRSITRDNRVIDIEKTLDLAAPVERVFAFWSNFENFPRFMAHVQEVKGLGDGRYQWTVQGPAGEPIIWNTFITRCVPNELLVWRTEPQSAVNSSGSVYFLPNAGGGTRVHIRITYHTLARVPDKRKDLFRKDTAFKQDAAQKISQTLQNSELTSAPQPYTSSENM